MNQLIWFSIPGAIVMFPLVPIMPDKFLDKEWIIGLIIIGIPVLGFIIHQLWRTIYEACGGYRSMRRRVIKAIINKKDWNITNRTDAFLVWEMTFYSKAIHESFREHDRVSWHYLMSFYACSTASAISIIIIIINHRIPNYSIALFAAICIMFIWKAKLTGKLLERQELTLLEIKEDDFKSNASKVLISKAQSPAN